MRGEGMPEEKNRIAFDRSKPRLRRVFYSLSIHFPRSEAHFLARRRKTSLNLA